MVQSLPVIHETKTEVDQEIIKKGLRKHDDTSGNTGSSCPPKVQ